jgi:hypothetical protein
VGAILEAVEREASRLREEARAETARYLEDARRQADALVAERQRRIAAVSEELLRKSEAVVARLEDAEPVRAGFESLVRALGDAAERLSRETGGMPPAAAPPAFHETWVPPAPPPPPGPEAPATAPAAATPAAEPGTEPPRFRPAREGGASPFTSRTSAEPAPPAQQPATPEPQPEPSARPWHRAEDSRLVAMQMAIAGSTRGEVRDHLAAVLGVLDCDRILDGIFGPGGTPEQRLPGTGEPR